MIKYYRIGKGNMLTYRISEETGKKKTCQKTQGGLYK